MRVFAALALISTVLPAPVRAQTPPMREEGDNFHIARQWLDAGSYHVARRNLETIFRHSSPFEQDRDVLNLLVESCYKDRDYEEAYQWSSEFVRDYPNDHEFTRTLFIEGISAYQTHRNDTAFEILSRFLKAAPNDPNRGAAAFWRAMAELDRGNATAAEDDMRVCLNDSSTRAFHDYVLLGWALSLERRGDYAGAATHLRELLASFPGSELATDCRIRLASVLLRKGDVDGALQNLDAVTPRYDYQREEYLLLRAEASMQLGRYADAGKSFGDYSDSYSGHPFDRLARYGLAWSYVKEHRYQPAETVFDSLARERDSLGYAAMFESGALSALLGNDSKALGTFDTLTEHSPYDRDAVQSYYQAGLIHYRDKHYIEARRYFQLAARLFSQSTLRPYAYHMLGETNFALGDYSNAQYDFVQAKHSTGDPAVLAPMLYHQGIALYRLGRFRSSVEAFSDFLQQFPADQKAPQGYAWKGEALYQDYRFPEAENTFKEALRRYPSNPKRSDASYGLAWSYFEQKQYAQAAAAFEKFAKDFPDDPRVPEASLRKADAYFSLGNYDKANALYASMSARKGGPASDYAAFQMAMSWVQRGDADRGVEELRTFLRQYPSSMYDEVAQFNIAWTYFSREQYQQALTEFYTLLRLYAGSQLLPRVLFNMGDAYYNLKQYDSARTYYQRVIEEFPSSLIVTDALSGLQYTYQAEGKPSAAVAEIEKVLKEKPTGMREEDLVMKKADILFGQGDFAGAIGEYQHVLKMNPDKDVRAHALQQLGRTYELNDNPQRASEYYERVLAETPEADIAPGTMLSLGLMRIQLKQYARAREILHEFGLKYPDSPLLPEVRYQESIADMNIPDRDAASQGFQSIIQKYPDNLFADRSRLRIAELLQQSKKFQPSIDTLTSVATRRSDDIAAEALLMIGDAYLAMNKIKDGMQAYNDLVKQYPDYPRIIDKAKWGLGLAYEKQRDRKRARAMYEEVAAGTKDLALKKQAEDKLRRLRK